VPHAAVCTPGRQARSRPRTPGDKNVRRPACPTRGTSG
jgi:hypothetical protein